MKQWLVDVWAWLKKFPRPSRAVTQSIDDNADIPRYRKKDYIDVVMDERFGSEGGEGKRW